MDETATKHRLLKLEKDANIMEPFSQSTAITFQGHDLAEFFKPSEEVFLLWEAIRAVEVDGNFGEIVGALENVPAGSELIFALKESTAIIDVYPLHVNSIKKELWKKCLWASPLYHSAMIDDVHSYFGSKIALYFLWMRHYSFWLVAPALFGGTISFINHFVLHEDTTEESLLTPFFSLFIIVWGAFFMQFWKRSCASKCCLWGIVGGGYEERDDVRPEFQGAPRVSPITGRLERHSPRSVRLAKYVVSALVTGAMLMVAAAVMVLSLNLQGYIRHNSFWGEWLHFHFLSDFAEPGAVFDPNGGGPYPKILPLVPVVGHTLVILLLNNVYSTIAESLTEWENHKTRQAHENAVIVKRFLFECFDCYVALFYLAFCQMDIVLLGNELASLYMLNSVRRIFCESILPVFIRRAGAASKKMTGKKDDSEKPSGALASALEEADMDPYEQFDDFMEMVGNWSCKKSISTMLFKTKLMRCFFVLFRPIWHMDCCP